MCLLQTLGCQMGGHPVPDWLKKHCIYPLGTPLWRRMAGALHPSAVAGSLPQGGMRAKPIAEPRSTYPIWSGLHRFGAGRFLHSGPILRNPNQTDSTVQPYSPSHMTGLLPLYIHICMLKLSSVSSGEHYHTKDRQVLAAENLPRHLYCD